MLFLFADSSQKTWIRNYQREREPLDEEILTTLMDGRVRNASRWPMVGRLRGKVFSQAKRVCAPLKQVRAALPRDTIN